MSSCFKDELINEMSKLGIDNPNEIISKPKGSHYEKPKKYLFPYSYGNNEGTEINPWKGGLTK